MRAIVVSLLFMILCWNIFYFSFRHDRSKYRNCYLLFIALMSGLPCIINIAGKYDTPVVMFLVYIAMFGLLIIPYFLIYNGFVMMKKEGKHLSHLLSLFLGIIILLGELAIIVNIAISFLTYNISSNEEIHSTGAYIFNLLFGMTTVYIAMSVMIFTIYILLLQIIPYRKNFDYIIILGSGLINGDKVSKLLKDRIDKAIEIYHKSENPPKLIPSGGKGSDETISEAEAIKRYLIAKEIPETDIILEDKSTTTYENLTNSKRIIDSFDGKKKTVLVSNNYHVYRALRYCRKIGFKCSGIGGHTAFYYWPCALLREYIAVHAEPKHAVILVIGWIMCIALTMAFLFGKINLL